ncbi:hypothetical protein ACFYXQ_46250 [Nocardia jiangxiensis]|uniref:Uncharacterized protein n=1 Tax=Nocardia jiangxiensis TaxID=282685 RepID=A0ABW6SFQ3_9NOCA
MVTVDPQVFYDGAKKLTDIGSSIETATTKLVQSLSGTGSMAGSSAAASTWATSYNNRAADAVNGAHRLAQTLPYLAGLIALAGYNHAMANYNADINPNKGRAPSKPATVPTPIPLCWRGAPSAGGPGNGLVSMAALMEKIHVHIPDGDTDKFGTASKAWSDFIGTEAVAHAAYEISGVNNTLGQIDSPEIGDLMDHLATARRSAHKVYEGGEQLATECDGHKQALDTLRKQINDVLLALDEALAVNLFVTIFADTITAGVGVILDGAALLKAGRDIDVAATGITEAVNAAQIDEKLTAAAGAEDKLANVSNDLDQIDALEPEDIGDLAEQEAAEDTSAASGSNLQASKTYAHQQQQMDHVFVPKHKLDDLVTSCGGQDAAMDQMIDSVQGVPNGIYGKANPLVRTINGQEVTIRGAMINGVFKISTAFIP